MCGALKYTCLPVMYDRHCWQRLLANSETQKYCPAELGVLGHCQLYPKEAVIDY